MIAERCSTTFRLALLGFLLFGLCSLANSQNAGSITGKVFDQTSREPLPYANVIVQGTTIGAATDMKGLFTIENLPPGRYTVTVSVVGYKTEEMAVTVKPGQTTRAEFALVPAPVQLGEVQVYGVSFREERITEAPAAISVIEARDFRLSGVSAQLPKLLETEPGVDIAQSGLNDFNVNTRGFNSSLNRRLQVLLDGRDLAIAFLGAQEWNGLSLPVEDLGRMELVRGPSSALYGANAFNGVINIQTPRPKEITGTKATIAGGEMSAIRGDLRYANAIGPWGYKLNVGRFQGDTWSVNRRNMRFEYPGFSVLNNEEADLLGGKVASTYLSGRLDYDLSESSGSTFETGITQVENEVFVTGIGRVQVPKAIKPWARVNFFTKDFYVQVWGGGRDSRDPQLSLSSGLPLIERSFIGQTDVQYRRSLFSDDLFVITGVSLRYQTIDTEGTLMKDARKDNSFGAYSQVEFSPLSYVKFVAAARYDQSTLHKPQVSPKLAVVWTPLPEHSFRATYNQAFQAPNLSERYLFVLRTASNPYTGFKSYFAYHGNPDLTAEEITGYELGYKGILNRALFVAVDGYYNELKNFITDLAPGVHPLYSEPTYLPGDSILRAIWSYSNAGKVTEQGLEIGLNYYFSDHVSMYTNYAFFDFRVLQKGDKDILIPNAPKHKINWGVNYSTADGHDIGLKMKYVPTFDWAAGIYQGKILAYTLIDLAGRYRLSHNLDLGLNITNLLDRQHYQIFGGSLIGRRAVLSLTAMY